MSPDDERRIVGRLRPLAVRHYAEARGWIRLEGGRWRVWLLRHPEERLRQLQIPMNRHTTQISNPAAPNSKRC